MTILLTPYMSCSAKIPIYAVFSAAFFPKYAAFVMIGLYALGIVLGILVALVLKGTLFQGKPVPFVMELPNYRFPSPRNVAILLWEKAWDFIRRAFTVIFTATILIWFLQTFDLRLNVVSNSADSILALVGRWIAPVFQPLGFGDWRAVTALISGFTAKEAVISTLGVLLGVGMDNLGPALGTLFTPLAAGSFLIFTLLYTPCVAAVATIRRELGSKLQTLGVVVMQCVVAWLAAGSPLDGLLLALLAVGVFFALRSMRRNRGCCGDCGRCGGCWKENAKSDCGCNREENPGPDFPSSNRP